MFDIDQIVANTIGYIQNLLKHLFRLVTLRESPYEAGAATVRNTRKWARAFRGRRTRHHREAIDYTEEGRHHFNHKRYIEAEEALRNAIAADAQYALAHTYLGYVLYKMGRYQEAALYWNQAIEINPRSHAAKKARENLEILHAKKEQVNAWLDDYNF